MLSRVTRWILVAIAGVLIMGLVGLGVSYAQGSAPAAPAACLMGRGAGPRGGLPQAAGWRWGGSMPQV